MSFFRGYRAASYSLCALSFLSCNAQHSKRLLSDVLLPQLQLSRLRLSNPWLSKALPSSLLAIALGGCAQHEHHDQEWQAAQQSLSDQVFQQQQLLESLHRDIQEVVLSQVDIQDHMQKNSYDLMLLAKQLKKPDARPPVKKKKIAQKATIVAPASSQLAPEKMSLGRVEWLWVELLNGHVKARIDTGAKTSSLHASDLQFFERDGENWVRFRIDAHKKIAGLIPSSVDKTYERPVITMKKVKQASADAIDTRPVIKLRVKVGSFEEDVEFNLTDRRNMLYPALLGRNFLKDVALVDVSKTFVQKRTTQVDE